MLGLPSKIVLIKGRPDARVLCEAANIAAIVSLREKLNMGRENVLKRTPKERRSIAGINVIKVNACRSSKLTPVEKALQKEFHTIPSSITCGIAKKRRVATGVEIIRIERSYGTRHADESIASPGRRVDSH